MTDRGVATSVPLEKVRHHGGTVLSRDPLTIESSRPQWEYAVSVRLSLDKHSSRGLRLPVKVSAHVTVHSGVLGCLIVGDDWTTMLGRVPPDTGPGDHTIDLIWDKGNGTANLVFRNHGAGDRPCVFSVHSVHLAQASVNELANVQRLEEMIDSHSGRLDVPRLKAAINKADAIHGDEDSVFRVLRRKWSEVPSGLWGRRGTSDLQRLPEDALRDVWTSLHQEATTGEGFGVRGWYHTLYRDVLRGKKVLEIGSGMGIDGIEFARHGAKMTFVDIAEDNLAVMQRLCAAFAIRDAKFVYLERLSALDILDNDYDVVWCQGSLLHAPFEFVKRECAAIVEHLRPGGRWIELTYPKERWVRDGCPDFRAWGTMTDGDATPWVEWYDLDRLLARLAPARFEPVLALNFHNDDFNWFDLAKVE